MISNRDCSDLGRARYREISYDTKPDLVIIIIIIKPASKKKKTNSDTKRHFLLLPREEFSQKYAYDIYFLCFPLMLDFSLGFKSPLDSYLTYQIFLVPDETRTHGDEGLVIISRGP